MFGKVTVAVLCVAAIMLAGGNAMAFQEDAGDSDVDRVEVGLIPPTSIVRNVLPATNQRAARPAVLPRTGPSDVLWAWVAGSLIALGTGAVIASRLRRV